VDTLLFCSKVGFYFLFKAAQQVISSLANHHMT